MIITIDRDTPPNEMHHIAIALQRIAAENGYVAAVEPGRTQVSETHTVGELSVKVDVDTTDATTAVETLAALIKANNVNADVLPPVTVTVREPGTVHAVDVTIAVEPPVTVTNDNLDSAGLPWDARIHAGSRERNTDGSWRVRRRPKGIEESEWEATLTRVTTELRDLMEIPVTPGAVADASAEIALTDVEIDQFVDIVQGIGEIPIATGAGLDAVIEQRETVIAPPIAVAPPVVVAPPAIEPSVTAVAPPIATASPAIETFAQLMSWLTSRTPKEEAAKPAMVVRVNEILTANGLTTLQQLGQRAELIPQVLAQFREAFGDA